MTLTATTIVSMRPSQVAECASLLARAFWDDPLMLYLLPDEASRQKKLEWFFTAGLKYGARYGKVETTESTPMGNAIWLPPGSTKTTMPRMLRVGFFGAPFVLGLGSFGRLMKLLNHTEHLHDRDMPGRHWYLFVLGVDPPHQGQGLGGHLVAPVLARADADGLPCYLETTKERNVTFYRKHGFEVVVDDIFPKSDLRYWTMKRPPGGA